MFAGDLRCVTRCGRRAKLRSAWGHDAARTLDLPPSLGLTNSPLGYPMALVRVERAAGRVLGFKSSPVGGIMRERSYS
jgi:hypothetical protein